LRGVDVTFGSVSSTTRVAADYNHVDPLDKFTDSFFGILIENPFLPPQVLNPIRAFVSQLGEDATALKTSNGNAMDPGSGSFAKGFGRWFEDKDFWLGSFESNDPPTQFTDQCAKISTGDGVSFAEFCDPLHLNTTGLVFLDFTTVSDLTFFDFPSSAP